MAEKPEKPPDSPEGHHTPALKETSSKSQAMSSGFPTASGETDRQKDHPKNQVAADKAPEGTKLRPGQGWDEVAKASEIITMTPEAPLAGRRESLWTLSYDDYTKEKFARAGFIYQGFGTKHPNTVHCFCCGVGYVNINPEEDPRTLIGRHRTDCAFLKIMTRAGTTVPFSDDDDPAFKCRSCRNNCIGAIFLPCGHGCCLQQDCLFKAPQCFKCRKKIEYILPLQLNVGHQYQNE